MASYGLGRFSYLVSILLIVFGISLVSRTPSLWSDPLDFLMAAAFVALGLWRFWTQWNTTRRGNTKDTQN